ncbi:1-phosphatidylinositol-3-phosphate 5-kinase [Lasallia pustulata]|uniref:1-phosphatidylinositol-3-phosphate 5-kinase n=1 Tax=Lasallia pustulata TaxID=136370 RepID=A0A1W5D2I8_9LECA|nr:1-phosphatidylinositol-3-phosphate 5-kinase [Lasallia pustulata]
MKPPLTPLTPTVPTVPASPAIVEVNVSAFRDLESRPRHEDKLSRTSTLNQVHSKASSSPRADEHVSGATDNLEVGEKTRGRAVRSYSGLESVSSHKPEPLRASGEDATIPGVSSIKHTSSSSQLGGHLGDHSVTGNASSRFQDTDRTDASNLSKARTTGEARNTAEGASGLKSSDRPTNASEKRQAIMSSVSASAITEASGSNHSIDKTSAAKARIAPRIAQSHLPGFDLSRASSSDTVGTSPLNTTMYQKSSNGGPSEDERLRKQDMTQLRNPGKQDTERSSVNVISSHTRSRVLSKEYWMRDENARDCFYCGDSFSTFRRKHHCRTCGQIFDGKCTSLVSGKQFGQPGSLRVCKPCEAIINGHDDSSDYSEDGSVTNAPFRPRHGSTSASEFPAFQNSPRSIAIGQEIRQVGPQAEVSVPTMAIPATRRTGDEAGRHSAVLEIEAERGLVRPGSSRSLRNTFVARSYPSNHKRHHSRHPTGVKPWSEERAPFHRDPADEVGREGRLPAFHSDNIIDPDLAPYLSDEDSSGDEQVSIMTAMDGDNLSRSIDNEKHGLTGLLAAIKKSRSRAGDKNPGSVTFASRDTDNISLSSFRGANVPRSSKRRNLSVSSNMLLRPSPRAARATAILPNPFSGLHGSSSSSAIASLGSPITPANGLRMIRSSSMRGADAPAVELNNASLHHVRKLLHQLLQDSAVSGVSSWEKALIPMLLQATDDVNPDVQGGDDIDIRHYVKLKKVPGGKPGDTSYVSGLVFTKNLALKSMPRSISHPNILILTFPLEYARREQHFMSLEPVIRQEREFLQNLVNRIAALRPQLLLVQRNVSGLALEFLEQANIATAYNVKPSVLEAVARCCQTRVISSIDKLSIKPAQAGTCASFYVKTYIQGRGKKTYMYLSGCPKELGCTIVLRGASTKTLATVKRITEFMVYVVYNLKLETCLMRDEFALIPSTSDAGALFRGRGLALEATQNGAAKPAALSSVIHGSQGQHQHELPLTQSSTDVANPDVLKSASATVPPPKTRNVDANDEIRMPDDVPMPTFYGDMVEKHKTKILSASPFVKFMQPYLLMQAREQERRLVYLKRLRDQDVLEEQNEDEKGKPRKFDLIKPEMVHSTIQGASKKVREVLHAVHDAEYDKALHNYKTQKKQWETYISGNINLFDPYAHQNIVVLYSVVCTVTTVPCSGPDLIALAFYNEHETEADFEADCTLGQYVEDLCLGANTICTANGCERKMVDHHRQYVHGEAQISVFVQGYPCKLRGLQDSILMWSCCRICGIETQVMPMSESTWKYSFGKYLELSFWSSNLTARADVCPHDLHRDHLRYFGFKDMALRVHYDPINLLEIIVPRARITWKVDNDLRFKNELFTRIEERLNKFMGSVKARIKGIKVEGVVLEKVDACKHEIERLTKLANDQHHALLRKLQNKYMDSKYYETIPLNRALRATQEKVAEWENIFADFDRNFFPSEKDIRRLATLQLRKIFLDRDESTTSLSSNEEEPDNHGVEGDVTEKSILKDTPALTPLTREMSQEKAHDMLTSVVQEHSGRPNAADEKQDSEISQTATPTSISVAENLAKLPPLQKVESEGNRHLDLTVPSCVPVNPISVQGSQVEESGPVSPTSTDHQRSTVIAAGAAPKSVERVDSEGSDFVVSPVAMDYATPVQSQVSGIPRPAEIGGRKTGPNISAPLYRAQSQPIRFRRDKSSSSGQSTPPILSTSPSIKPSQMLAEHLASTAIEPAAKTGEKRLSGRMGLGALKPVGVTAHSLIPRSIANRRKESKVSTLAKHFEQLSREFEKERLRERRQRAAKSKQARAYPIAASKPIVEVYSNVHEAVEEKEPSDEGLSMPEPSHKSHEEPISTIENLAHATTEGIGAEPSREEPSREDLTAENTETDDNAHGDSRRGSDVEGDEYQSDDNTLLDDVQIPGSSEDHHALTPSEAQLDLKLDLPRHEKTSLMKMLTNFWAERSASGWQALEYPLNAADHIFADSDIIVREDEPSSLIAFALSSDDYRSKLQNISEKGGGLQGKHGKDYPQDPILNSDEQVEVERSLLRSTGTHLKYQFNEGSAKMLCKIFFAEQFDAVRRKCGVADRIVESLSRCLQWDSKGGKTKSVFLKTLDDRLVLKSLSHIETQAFLRFAPAYFQIMSEALFHELPSVIAKMLGFYQVVIKNPVTGTEFNWFLLVMENLFYDRSPTRIFDLKGSMRNRKIQSTGEQNEVLLDENMVEFIYESPLFAREHSKKLLRASVWNDTLFLARQNVMDYSLMIAIDENRKELVVGIIDCIRTYTWDKKLESWIKDRGKNRPTVTSPKEYKSRFREAMGRYVLQAPNCWHQFKAQQLERRPLRFVDRVDLPERDCTGSQVEDAVDV